MNSKGRRDLINKRRNRRLPSANWGGTTGLGQKETKVADPRSPHPALAGRSMDDEIANLAMRAASGDRVAARILNEYYEGHDVEYDNRYENPTHRTVTIDRRVNGFHSVKGFS
jgi:hypothetical protein